MAPAAPPQEVNVTHIHHGPSRVGTILTAFSVAVVAVILSYNGAVFLAAEAGYARPERAVIECLISLTTIAGIIGVLAGLVRFVLTDYWAHREAMEQKRIEFESVRMRMAQLIPPVTQARMTRDEARRYQAVKLVMDRAYQMVDDQGRLRTKTQPWSRREVGRLRLLNEPGEIGEGTSLAGWVSPYLQEKGILLGDRQINLVRFPNLSAVEAQLTTDFGPPILYQSGDLGMSTHYLERGSPATQSWG